MPETLDSLLHQKNKKILFAGIGNILRSDDGVGVYISRKIEDNGNTKSISPETAIENYIGKINSLHPDILVLIDCVDMKAEPGTYILLNINKIHDFTFNTHNISLKRLTEFFRMKVYILGIQPEKLDFGEKISYFVKKSADLIVKRINEKEVCYGGRISV